MKLVKTLLVLSILQSCQVLAIDINADPQLTGAAGLPQLLAAKSQNANNDGFDNTPIPTPEQPLSRMFGAQLFNGSTADSGSSIGFNPSYIIGLGDTIQIRLWGAFNFDGALPVDPKGNIFVPNVGPLKVTGVSNGQLNSLVTAKIKEVYQSNVNVYASLLQAQPVKVFVTGYVRNPGLYGGVASDSLLSYLSKAGGVDSDRGSYVDITVKRGKNVRSHVNLYDFLLNGSLNLSQFSDGDTIVVGPRQYTFSVEGDVYNSYDFEFHDGSIPVSEALEWSRPKPGATHFTIIRQQGAMKRTEYYPLSNASGKILQDGDKLIISSDRYAGTIQVRIEGAHSGEHAMVLPYGATMASVLDKIRANSMSQVDAIQLYRKSLAERQTEMLNVELNKLQQAVLTTPSSTSEEANLRAKEAEMVLQFVAKAREVQPKGQVVLNEKTMATTLLEDGDVIVIPEKSSLVAVHGMVMFPNAVAWQNNYSVANYIEKTGGYAQSKGKSRVIVIRQNGEALAASRSTRLNPGDEIMVLPEVKTKSIEVTRGITSILYHLAVAAKVILDL